MGAARFEVLGIEQLCDTDNNGHVDNEPIYPSIVVLNYGWEAEIERPQPLTALGDLTRVYEAIPFRYDEKTCYGDIHGDVYAFDWSADTEFPWPVPAANVPIWGATVSTIVREEGPFDLDDVLGCRISLLLYTVPGQVRYDAVRKVVLSEADVIVFVADSRPSRREQNIWSMQNLRMNMRAKDVDPERVPILYQINPSMLDCNQLVDHAPPVKTT